ncbi:MAG: hypothetical protein KDE34_28395, partial [Anaerolineales bacterium]|nr:hypothetical protein [Anaerolineales bacterium]
DFGRFRQVMQYSFSTLFPFHSSWLQRWLGPAGQTALVAWQLLLLAATALVWLRGGWGPVGLAPTRRVPTIPSTFWLALLLLAELPLVIFLTDGSSPLLIIGLFLLAIFMLGKRWRYQPAAPDKWAIFLLVAACTLTLVGSFALEWVWNRWQWWALTSLVGEQARMAKFVYLPLYLLNGQLLAWSWARLPSGQMTALYFVAVILLSAVHRPVAILLLLLLTAWFLATRTLDWHWQWLTGVLVWFAGLLLLTATFLWPLDWGQLILL